MGYCLERCYELPPMTFNTDEIEALVVGARVVGAWGDPELAEAVRSAMAKIEAGLPRALQAVLHSTAIFVPSGSWGRVWSMAAWCEQRQGWHFFGVDRMNEVELLEPFEDTETISLQAFVEHQEEHDEFGR